jgi:hypothetical protein
MFGASAANAATPGPGLTIHSLALPTHFSTGETDAYRLTVTSAGSQPAAGPIVVKDLLPAGLGVARIESAGGCTYAGAPVTVTCTFPDALEPDRTLELEIYVTVKENAVSGEPNTATVTAGGASAPAPVSRTENDVISATPPPFGVPSFEASIAGLNGLLDTQAGGHPYELTTRIDFNSELRVDPEGNFSVTSVEDPRDLVIDLPLGFFGSARATPTCTFAQLASHIEGGVGGCPPDTVVGHISTEPRGGASLNGPIYNMVPEFGVAAEFGLVDALAGTHALYESVAPGPGGYLLRISAREVPQIPLTDLVATFYGDPAVKDAETICGSGPEPKELSCREALEKFQAPSFTNPSVCSSEPLSMAVHVDSWQRPGASNADGTPDVTGPGWVTAQAPVFPKGLTGCDELQFSPSLTLAPEAEHSQADEPAGYEVALKVPQTEAVDVLAAPPLKNAVVTLPPGVAISPSAANGLVGCQETGPEGINFGGAGPGHCPKASKVGTVEAVTPLLEEPLTEGSVYVAQPTCGGPGQAACTEEAGETGGIFSIYLQAASANRGIYLKLKGKVEVGGAGIYSREHGLQPGQVRTSFAELPQQPLSELRLKFKGGARALLANPQACGTLTTNSELTSWSGWVGSDPGPAATPSDSFAITGCENRFAPSFTAGTIEPRAGAFSPFTLTFSRQDREQDLSGLTVSMPPGLLGKIASVPQCPAAAANAGTCGSVSPGSGIGTATASAGSGSRPFWQSGSVYLTGPYRGAPFGLSIVLPVVAGPYNLGNLVVRAAISIDPHTAALTVTIDPLPQSVDGVPLRVQTVHLMIEGFIFNPTDCNPLAIDATITSTQGTSAPVSSRFQVSGCRALPFSPKLTALTYGNGQFTGHGASLHMVIATAEGQANMRSLKLDLPQKLPARLETIQKACPEAVFKRNPAACPKASVIGSASVQTPILAGTMAGPAYLVAKSGSGTSHPGESKTEKEEAAFPDLVLVLQNQGVTIDLTGGLFVSAKNITSVAFRSIPDVPIRRLDLVLPEGKSSVLAASASLCAKPLHILTAITGQNGVRVKPTVKVAVAGCKHKKKHHPSRRKVKTKRHAHRR